MLSKILTKNLGTNIVSNLNDEWKNLSNSDLGYPQATLVIKEEIYNSNPKIVESFVQELKSSIAFLYKNPENSIQYIKENNLSLDTSIF